jgi:putative DNA primase/helicase
VIVDSEFVLSCLVANELGDGMLYAALHRNQFIFAKNSQQWYAWDRHSWIRDDMDRAVSAVENVANCYAMEIKNLGEEMATAMSEPTPEEQKSDPLKRKIGEICRRIRRLRTDQGRKNCLKFAHTNPSNPLSINGVEFDQKPWLLACANGVINLKTGVLETGRQEDFLCKRSPIDFLDINTPAPTWKRVFEEINDGNQEIISYLHRLYGYGITGLHSEHVFPVLQGRGRNGKSIVVECLSHVLGEHAGPVAAEMLLESPRGASASQSTPEIMDLKGMRLVFASETDDGRRFSASRVKWLTGGDTLKSRGLYDRHITEFEPTHLLLLLTNHKPVAPDTDFAFWERCFLVPHNLSFVDRPPTGPHERAADKTIPDKLRGESSGILSWLVRGCLEWQELKGLHPPDSIIEATNEYQDDENYMTAFISCCCIDDDLARTSAADLYKAFVLWYQANVNAKKAYTPAQKGFTSKVKALERYNFLKSNGLNFFRGVRLNDDYALQILDAGED